MSIIPGSYQYTFAPRDGEPAYPELWDNCIFAASPSLGPSGTRLYDWSGRSRNADMVTMTGAANERFGGYNCLKSNGSTEYLTTPPTAFPSGSQSRTVSLWAHATGGARGGMAGCRSVSTGWFFGQADTNTVWYAVIGVTNTSATLATAFTAGNSLRHLAMVHNVPAQTVDIYENGIRIGGNTGTAGGTTSSGTTGQMFREDQGYVSEIFAGRLTDIRIYNAPLPLSAIKLLARYPGIAYELVPRRRTYSIPAGGGFQVAWGLRSRLVTFQGPH